MPRRNAYTNAMQIALLGRQPKIGLAELESLYGAQHVRPFGDSYALVETDELDISRLGGSLKTGTVQLEVSGDWRSISRRLLDHYSQKWNSFEGKLTLGISNYGSDVGARDVQKIGLTLKSSLKKAGVSVRLVPNSDGALSTATSHHNKLGLSANKVELFIVRSGDKVVIAESTGAQNITAYAKRDQGRPKRDAFVGMLPPKLAQIMINLAHPAPGGRVLDPFCGTGVILQEALLMDYDAYGSDLAEKMARYSEANLTWLENTHRLQTSWNLIEGDAMTTQWQTPIDAVVCESYLGQPFSAPPSPGKLRDVRGNCEHIIGSFLKNIAPQLASGTPLCVAVPAWKDTNGQFTHLPLTQDVGQYGFTRTTFSHVNIDELLYFRDDQVVARELLILTKQ